MSTLRTFVGLGNPGPSYAATRHNIGFMAVDAIAVSQGLSGWHPKFKGVYTDGRTDGHRFLLVKPLTYMNNSGECLTELMQFYKFSVSDIVIIHDEIDLPLGKIKIKQGGGTAGHNGLKSLDQHIGPDYWRVRIGIGHPGNRDEVHHYVLRAFEKEEQPELKRALKAVEDIFPYMLTGEMKDLSNRLPPDLRAALNPPNAGEN